MMNDMKKSDEPVRAMRLANNGGRPSAELAEQRGSTKENPGSQATRRTQCRGSVPSAADRIPDSPTPASGAGESFYGKGPSCAQSR